MKQQTLEKPSNFADALIKASELFKNRSKFECILHPLDLSKANRLYCCNFNSLLQFQLMSSLKLSANNNHNLTSLRHTYDLLTTAELIQSKIKGSCHTGYYNLND